MLALLDYKVNINSLKHNHNRAGEVCGPLGAFSPACGIREILPDKVISKLRLEGRNSFTRGCQGQRLALTAALLLALGPLHSMGLWQNTSRCGQHSAMCPYTPQVISGHVPRIHKSPPYPISSGCVDRYCKPTSAWLLGSWGLPFLYFSCLDIFFTY